MLYDKEFKGYAEVIYLFPLFVLLLVVHDTDPSPVKN